MNQSATWEALYWVAMVCALAALALAFAFRRKFRKAAELVDELTVVCRRNAARVHELEGRRRVVDARDRSAT